MTPIATGTAVPAFGWLRRLQALVGGSRRAAATEAALRRRIAELEGREAELHRQRQEMARLAEELVAARDQADRQRLDANEASRAKSYFLATMSHELRTPLNAILGFSEIMKERLAGLDTIETYRQYSCHIHDSGAHLLALINDILDLAKIEAGRLELAEEKAEMKQIIRACIALMTQAAARGQVGLVLRLEPAPTVLMLDSRLCKQMLFNLLSNAVKFTRPGGTVTVDLAQGADGTTVTVSDTGAGIDPAEMERIMQPFCQGSSALTTPARGTGLGLPLVKAYAEAHGGRFTIESTVGEGTRTSLWFPPERMVAAPEPIAGLRLGADALPAHRADRAA